LDAAQLYRPTRARARPLRQALYWSEIDAQEVPVALTPQTNLVETLLSPFANFLRSWDYRPVTSWFEHFVTINWNSGDADVEEHVLGEVGSYGLQLARILDAVDLLVGELDLSRLTPEQQRIVVRLEDLTASANRAVREYRGRPVDDAPTPGRGELLPRAVDAG
jgi:hypothetical protein